MSQKQQNPTTLKKSIMSEIESQYGAKAEYLWPKTPNCCIFRHNSNRKWFAVIMQVAGNKLGFKSNQLQDIINVKCDAYLISSLCQNQGFLPAYHMNKTHWNSIILDGSVPDKDIQRMIGESYDLTKGKKK